MTRPDILTFAQLALAAVAGFFLAVALCGCTTAPHEPAVMITDAELATPVDWAAPGIPVQPTTAVAKPWPAAEPRDHFRCTTSNRGPYFPPITTCVGS